MSPSALVRRLTVTITLPLAACGAFRDRRPSPDESAGEVVDAAGVDLLQAHLERVSSGAGRASATVDTLDGSATVRVTVVLPAAARGRAAARGAPALALGCLSDVPPQVLLRVGADGPATTGPVRSAVLRLGADASPAREEDWMGHGASWLEPFARTSLFALLEHADTLRIAYAGADGTTRELAFAAAPARQALAAMRRSCRSG